MTCIDIDDTLGGLKQCCPGSNVCCDATPFTVKFTRDNNCGSDIEVTLGEEPINGKRAGFIINNHLEFINSLESVSSERRLQASHGVDDSLTWYTRRTMVADGFIYACSRGELARMTEDLKRVFSLSASQNYFNRNGYLDMEFTDECGRCLSTCVKPVGTPQFSLPQGELTCFVRNFTFTVQTQNEKFLECTENEVCGNETPLVGTTVCDLKLCGEDGICLQPDVGAEACNEGTYEASPIITISGPATNPRFWNLTNGSFMQINTTIDEFTTIVIDVEAKIIKEIDFLGNEKDITGLLSDDSDYIFLETCCNDFALTTDNSELLLSSFCMKWQNTFI